MCGGSRIPIWFYDVITTNRLWFAQGRDTDCRISGFSVKDYQPSNAAAAIIIRKPTICLNIIDYTVVIVNPVNGWRPLVAFLREIGKIL